MSVLYMWWLLAFTAVLPSCQDYVRAKIKELNVTRNWFGALLFSPYPATCGWSVSSATLVRAILGYFN